MCQNIQIKTHFNIVLSSLVSTLHLFCVGTSCSFWSVCVYLDSQTFLQTLQTVACDNSEICSQISRKLSYEGCKHQGCMSGWCYVRIQRKRPYQGVGYKVSWVSRWQFPFLQSLTSFYVIYDFHVNTCGSCLIFWSFCDCSRLLWYLATRCCVLALNNSFIFSFPLEFWCDVCLTEGAQ